LPPTLGHHNVLPCAGAGVVALDRGIDVVGRAADDLEDGRDRRIGRARAVGDDGLEFDPGAAPIGIEAGTPTSCAVTEPSEGAPEVRAVEVGLVPGATEIPRA
jgi:hypothetical protein